MSLSCDQLQRKGINVGNHYSWMLLVAETCLYSEYHGQKQGKMVTGHHHFLEIWWRSYLPS
jgi:hypothetical protein